MTSVTGSKTPTDLEVDTEEATDVVVDAELIIEVDTKKEADIKIAVGAFMIAEVNAGAGVMFKVNLRKIPTTICKRG